MTERTLIVVGSILAGLYLIHEILNLFVLASLLDYYV